MIEVVQTDPPGLSCDGELEELKSASNDRLNPPMSHPSVYWSANSALFAKNTVMGLLWRRKDFSYIEEMRFLEKHFSM